MTRRTAKKKDTLTGLRRMLKAMTLNRDDLETQLRQVSRQRDLAQDKLKDLQHVHDSLKGDLENLKLENAELHGYINRVEQDDRERFLTNAGRKPVKVYNADRQGEMVEYEGLYGPRIMTRSRRNFEKP
jgi:uncharacterized protein (DUF3084 family)